MSPSVMGIAAFVKVLNSVIFKRAMRFAWTASLAAAFAKSAASRDPFTIAPDIILAGIPVWHVNKIGHASSDEILKYRSMGGIFLAHQKGGKQTFKFTAKMFGPMRFLTVKALEGLLSAGAQQEKSVNSLNFDKKTDLLEWTDKTEKVLEAESILGGQSDPLVEYSKKGEFSDQDYAYHRTFPIITETRIYTDMYMETLVIREDVKYGKDCVEVQCAFRQYIAPTHYQKTPEPLTPEELDPISEAGAPKIKQGKKEYFRTYIPKNQINILKRLDMVMNFGWAVGQTALDIMAQKEFYQKEQKKKLFEVAHLTALWVTHQIYQGVKYAG
ncbi:hypothetical protein DRO61_09790 [Candidatus Bathyarchaeota archaeon]|nr:MAG: hypothetical protein DRO61_09790 [Candidatus Bathyarchaeota archaeon]